MGCLSVQKKIAFHFVIMANCFYWVEEITAQEKTPQVDDIRFFDVKPKNGSLIAERWLIGQPRIASRRMESPISVTMPRASPTGM